MTSPSTLESRKKAEREASERIRFLDTEFRVGRADGRALRDGSRRSRRGPPGDSPGQAAFGPARRDHPFPRDRARLRRARRLPARPGARGDRRRRRHLHRPRRAPPDADRDLQGTADLLQPRQLLLERHPRAHPGRDVRAEPRPSREVLRRSRPTDRCRPARRSGTPAASTIRASSRPLSRSRRWQGGRVAEVRLYPVDLGYGRRLTTSGTPRLASAEMGRGILERLQRISKPYGTTIEIEDGVGVIRLR